MQRQAAALQRCSAVLQDGAQLQAQAVTVDDTPAKPQSSLHQITREQATLLVRQGLQDLHRWRGVLRRLGSRRDGGAATPAVATCRCVQLSRHSAASAVPSHPRHDLDPFAPHTRRFSQGWHIPPPDVAVLAYESSTRLEAAQALPRPPLGGHRRSTCKAASLSWRQVGSACISSHISR